MKCLPSLSDGVEHTCMPKQRPTCSACPVQDSAMMQALITRPSSREFETHVSTLLKASWPNVSPSNGRNRSRQSCYTSTDPPPTGRNPLPNPPNLPMRAPGCGTLLPHCADASPKGVPNMTSVDTNGTSSTQGPLPPTCNETL